MKDIYARVSYLQGLSEGLNINDGSPQGKIIYEMLNVFGEMAHTMSVIQSDFENFKEYVESIDDDLLNLEEDIRGAGDGYQELMCPSCGEELYFECDEDVDAIEIVCPECNEVVFVNDGSFDYNHSYIKDEVRQDKSGNSPS